LSFTVPQKLPSRGWLVLMLGSLSAFVPLSIDMYLPAFPQIAEDFGVEVGQVQLTLSVYIIGMAFGQAFYGSLADRWGRRGPLIFGMVIFTLATIGCAMAGSIGSLIGWRIGVAVGGSAGMVVTRAVVRDSFGESESANLYATLMLVMGAAPIFAPLIGGQMLLLASWRWIFWLIAIFSTVCLVGVVTRLPETLKPEDRITHGLGEILKVYGRLFRNRLFMGYVLSVSCVSSILFAYISGSPSLFIEQYGQSPQAFSVLFGLNAGGMVLFAQSNRWWLRHYEPREIVAKVFLFTLVMAGLLTGQLLTGWGGFPLAVTLLFCCVASAGLLFPNLAALAMAPVGRVAGSASALMGTVQFALGGAAGAVVGFLHDGTARPMVAMLLLFSVLGVLFFTVMAKEGGTSGEV